MSLRKYQAVILIVTLGSTLIFPSALFAKGNLNTPQASTLSQETRQKFLEEKQQLKALGNLKEYANVEVQWNNEKQKPSEIRNLHKKASKDIVSDTKKVIGDLSALYSLAPTFTPDVRLEQESTSKLTQERHVRLQQFHNNLEIVWGEIISHVDKDGFVYQVDGTVDTPNVSTIPKISTTEALNIGKKEHGTKAKFQVMKKPELVLYKFASAYILAYRYTIGYDDPIALIGQWIYYIDANTGKKINSYSLMDTANNSTPLNGASLSGENGNIKTFTGIFDTATSKYYMYDMFSTSGSYIVYNTSSNTGMYTDAWFAGNRSTPSWGNSDPVEISAAYNISKTLEYYNTFGFGPANITFTATGQTYIPVYVHYGSGYSNAAWNPGDGLYIGDGDGVNFKPLAVLDVMAHEFWHAWTQNTSKLMYQNEQGALNESFSDISGINVESYVQQDAMGIYPKTTSGQSDWLIGEDAIIRTTALRDMRNPANTAVVGTGNEQPTKYHGAHWYFGTADFGGVHQNNSVQNFFYYLLSEGGSGNNEGILYSLAGIGIGNARRVAFETNTHFVTSTSDYKAVRQAWIDAANSINPSYVPVVKAAWDAVGVIGDPIVTLATASESFENSTNLPVGYTTSLIAGSGNPWTVTTTTGALGNNSLVSGIISDNSSNAVSWSGITDAGYMTYYWRTSSEVKYDTLDFFIDGVMRNSWSGINPWSFYSDIITSGPHIFTWRYYKDISGSGWLDQVGIDAVHTVSMTGILNYGSDGGTGQYVSAAWFHGLFNALNSYDYIVSRSDGQMLKGSASGTLSFPLIGLPEWSGSMDFQYRDLNGFLSPIFTKSFFLDSIAPSITQILTPNNAWLYNTGNIALSWNPITDTGAGLSTLPYTYLISTNSGFTNTIFSGSISLTGILLSLPDSNYFAEIQSQDLVNNMSVSPIISFSIDTVAPLTPTNVVVNHGNIIDASTQNSVTISGSGGISESGSNVYYTLSSSSGSISGSGIIDISGDFSFSWINVTTLADGILSYSLWMIDIAGNTGAVSNGTIGKSVIPAAGNAVFLSGAYTNTGITSLEISVAKAVSYSISGSGIVSTITGSLSSSGSIIIPITLSANDGNKTIQITFTDGANVTTTAIASIILDTTLPILSIDSHLNNAQVTGSAALMTGSIFDLGGIANATLNSVPLISPSNWSKSINLAWGNNTFILTATDNAGNSTSLSVTIKRLTAISNIVSSFLSTDMKMDFDTDLSATGVIHYGTNSGNMNLVQNTSSSNGLHHNTTLTGLTAATPYYYTIQGSSSWVLSNVSPVQSFYTPQVIDTVNNFSGTTSTGAIIFSGSSNTGSTIFPGTGTLSIKSETNSIDTVILNFSGLTITPTSAWDGILEAPKVVSLSGITLSENGYMLTGSVYKAGNTTTALSLSGQSAMIQIYVGTSLDNTSLHVYRSDTGSIFSPIDTCIVSAGICQFQTNHFSYFTFGVPNNSTPNTFVFVSQTGVDPSTNIDSNIITLSGTNIPATISISGGMYSINSLAFTSATGTILSGDIVKVRVTSSVSYSTTTQATLTIGGISANFSVITKSAPAVSNGGSGWGGGGSIQSVDVCPQWDTSGNLYDGKCAGISVSTSVISTSTWAQTLVTPSKTFVVSKSGPFSSNPIIASYSFSWNERIPQKVAAELNFFVTKLIKVIDKNAGNNEIKRARYNQIVKRYIINRVSHSSDEREKRIMEYLYRRSSIVMKMRTL